MPSQLNLAKRWQHHYFIFTQRLVDLLPLVKSLAIFAIVKNAKTQKNTNSTKVCTPVTQEVLNIS